MTRILAHRYELTTALGRGGMGQVWEAVDRQLARKVAVKLLTNEQIAHRRDRSELVRRFARESTLTAGLQHPGVPTVHDAGSYDGGLYLVMELVEGRTIGDVIADQGPLSAAWTAAIGAQVCAVLAVAHEGGLVHRDIKPHNLMLTRDGTVKVLDFGVATMLDAAGASRITHTGQTIGTPAYMAPEQFRSGEANSGTDLYALGCVLYEMLAGEPVFQATSPHAMVYKHLEEEPAPLRRNDLPHGLEWLVRLLLAKEIAQRPAGARDVYARLLQFVHRLPALGEIDPCGSELTGMQLQARALAAMASSSDADPHAGPQTVPPHAGPSTDPRTPSAEGPPPAIPVGYQAAGGSASFGLPPAGPPPPGGPAPSGLPQPGPLSAPSPGAFTPPPGRPSHGIGWKTLHSLWVLPSLTMGLLTWLGFLYIGIRHSSRKWLITSAVYGVLGAMAIVLVSAAPDDDSPLSTAAGLLLLVVWFGGLLHSLVANLERLSLRSALDLGPPHAQSWPPAQAAWPADQRAAGGSHGW